MIYKFYDYESFVKQKKENLLKQRFAISNSTYQKIFDTDNGEMLYFLLTNRNKYDICYEESIECQDIPMEVALAIQYEKMCHPDELVFITSDKKNAEIANKYLGQDSIIYLK